MSRLMGYTMRLRSHTYHFDIYFTRTGGASFNKHTLDMLTIQRLTTQLQAKGFTSNLPIVCPVYWHKG
jgi:hypothetical protein